VLDDRALAPSSEVQMIQLHQTLRRLRNSPGFALTSLLTLAIGIGATTAIFSVVNGILLKPLPFDDADRLISVGHRSANIGDQDLSASPVLYRTYRENNRTFESIALWWNTTDGVAGAGDPEDVPSLRVTHDFLPTLRVAPLIGRPFSEADDTFGNPKTVMLSYAYWQRRFGGAEDALGTSITIGGEAHTVIGVLPREFRFLQRPADILLPYQINYANEVYGTMGQHAIARLKPNVTLADVSADIERMVPIAMEAFPLRGANAVLPYRPYPRPLRDYFVGDLGNVLWVLMATIGMLLIVACANVANLQLARTESRGHELAIHSALGASRGHLVRSVLLESTVLGLAGGMLGLALAAIALPMFLEIAGGQLPTVLAIGIDWAVLGFALAISLGAGVLFGCVPALKYGARSVATALAGRTHSATRERHRARSSLVVAQVALALVLLVAAGLMIRSFDALRNVEPGFSGPDQLQVFTLTIPQAVAPDIDRMLRMQRDIHDGLAAIPGVESVGFQSFLPLSGGPRGGTSFEDKPTPAGTLPRSIEFRHTSPGFVETMRTPLIAGRTFEWSDLDDDRRVALVSLGLARAEWGSAEAALGKRVRIITNQPWHDIVGVIGDVHDDGLEVPAQDAVYYSLENPFAYFGGTRRMSFAVRSARAGTAGFADEIQRAVWSVDDTLPLAQLETMGDVHSRALARTSLTLTLLGITGAMALTLGLVGIYGVVSYMMVQRTREIGIRIALGARSAAVRRLLIGHVLVLVAIGGVLGLGGAVTLAQLMRSLLFGVGTLDLPTYAIGSLSLFGAAALAAYLPARRVTRVDPIRALKTE
jgi:predicted permease